MTLCIREMLQRSSGVVGYRGIVSSSKAEDGGTTKLFASCHYAKKKKWSCLPTIPCILPVPTIRDLRWRTGGEGEGARPRIARTTTSPVRVRTAGGRGPRGLRAEGEIPTRRRQHRPVSRPRTTSSLSV